MTTRSQKQEQAAVLVAEDELSDEAIAERVGVSRMTLHRWKRDAAFQRRVTEIVASFGLSLQRFAIARKDKRMAAYQNRWDRMKRLMEARAADPSMEGVPGGKTGLIVRRVKRVGPASDALEAFAIEAMAVLQGVANLTATPPLTSAVKEH
ncbi:MAG TPA: phBC6A51 family helix-turn-helix protein [Chloroflexota bacterium]|nr:phBC6A51 family helix-turn-helix protein [Chloroflexota bacterium]